MGSRRRRHHGAGDICRNHHQYAATLVHVPDDDLAGGIGNRAAHIDVPGVRQLPERAIGVETSACTCLPRRMLTRSRFAGAPAHVVIQIRNVTIQFIGHGAGMLAKTCCRNSATNARDRLS